MNWRDHAACRHSDPETFFPLGDRQRAAAQLICEGCPVQDACAAFADRVGIGDGIWGGRDTSERRTPRSSRSRGGQVVIMTRSVRSGDRRR